MTDSERIKDHYNQHLIPEISADVMAAELARQNGDHEAVMTVFEKWILHQDHSEKEPVSNDQRLINRLQEDAVLVRGGLAREEDLIRVGLAGLGRIRHVDLNSLLRRTNPSNQQQLLEATGEVDALYQRLDLKTLVPWTIHRGSIHWLSEVVQDRVNTQTIIGRPQEAERILNTSVAQAVETCDRLERIVDVQTPEGVLEANNYNAYRERKLYLGSLSALGVLVARRAKITHFHPDMTQGLGIIREAYQYEPNPHRLATLALWTLQASISGDYHKSLSDYVRGLGLGITSYFRALKDDPKSTLSATKQFRSKA